VAEPPATQDVKLAAGYRCVLSPERRPHPTKDGQVHLIPYRSVGDALAAFYGGSYYAQIIKPIQDGLMASAAQLIALTDSLR
jgi:hypothetical protein